MLGAALNLAYGLALELQGNQSTEPFDLKDLGSGKRLRLHLLLLLLSSL